MPCRAVSCGRVARLPASEQAAARPAVQGRRTAGSDLRHTSIRERPAEVEGRLVPGHWEGDLIKGAGNRSSVGTLVERTSRKLVLSSWRTPKRRRYAMVSQPACWRCRHRCASPLTCDQGKEMARHRELAALTGLRVYFADPHAPWQRGSNGNTNGLLRQYLPKGTNLSVFSQAELDAIAARLNSRPRKTLGFATPDEVFAALVNKAANAVTTRNAEGVRYGT